MRKILVVEIVHEMVILVQTMQSVWQRKMYAPGLGGFQNFVLHWQTAKFVLPIAFKGRPGWNKDQIVPLSNIEYSKIMGKNGFKMMGESVRVCSVCDQRFHSSDDSEK